ncbi:hypothetical protein M413DRAFT_15838 [Hebeloma cylindrosporum]|uniref:Diphthamide biosynthesis protein 4 n=1 Tax=Hebeloma cylindrosporum TaxID=76867 RepID=A0A0C3CV40_HEBCY|nr:hypothetical protein M413DRAFT_15838 [Hebeloma cylindrosporum h7]
MRSIRETLHVIFAYSEIPLLSVPKDASFADVKAAYHRVLLQSHPDKQSGGTSSSTNLVDIALIKEAYAVLSNDERRAVYDSLLSQRTYTTTPPRPAQVISLEEFEDEAMGNIEEDREGGPWRYPCRCGGSYSITTELMDKGEHLIACNSCSEVVWVGYEIMES